MKRNLYSIFLLPSFIIIFVLFYIQIGLAFGFVSKNIGEGGLFFAVIFFILMLLQAILLIPAYLSYKKIEDINEKQKIKNIFVITLSLVIFLIFLEDLVYSLLSFPIKLILIPTPINDQITAGYISEAIIDGVLVLVFILLSIMFYKKNLLHYALLFLILSLFSVFEAYNSSVFGIEHYKSEKKYEDVEINIVRSNINLILNGTGKPEWCNHIRFNDYINNYISYQNLCYTMAALRFQNESICEISATGRRESELTEQKELCKKLVQAAIANELKPTLCEEDKSTGSDRFKNPNEWRTCNYYVNLYFKGQLE